MDKNLIYNGEDLTDNWFFNKYYYSGSNLRYFTFQMVLNLLNQRHPNPTIIETGCQRQEEDLGAGMSTSIFAEYVSRYGGTLHVVDNTNKHLLEAIRVTNKWPEINIHFYCMDSVKFLTEYDGPCSLLYLDSFDYPYVELLRDHYGGWDDFPGAVRAASAVGRADFVKRHYNDIIACQEHALNEFKAIENKLATNTILLIDDNTMAGGGKPRLLKDYLVDQDWTCILDSQGTLWVRKI